MTKKWKYARSVLAQESKDPKVDSTYKPELDPTEEEIEDVLKLFGHSFPDIQSAVEYLFDMNYLNERQNARPFNMDAYVNCYEQPRNNENPISIYVCMLDVMDGRPATSKNSNDKDWYDLAIHIVTQLSQGMIGAGSRLYDVTNQYKI